MSYPTRNKPPVKDVTQSRRRLLQNTAAAGATLMIPSWLRGNEKLPGFGPPSERPIVGCIGTGYRHRGVSYMAMQYTDVAALCDVDKSHFGPARKWISQIQGDRHPVTEHEDYREILDRKDIDVVTITTPDHWHAKIAIDAMRAGKDVYCEKPLTLTIEEGKQIIKVLKETGRVFQVGTQQRTAFDQNFLKAIALIRAGRIGQVKRVQCGVGEGPSSPVIPVVRPPGGLNWDVWLGQAPKVDYRSAPSGDRDPYSRCHYTFRWWYEYAGGRMTDWGAHHVDIAQWAIGMEHSGPLWVEGTGEHPVELKSGVPTRGDRYNTATRFRINAKFPNGVEMVIRSDTENGIQFEGTEGQFFVGRDKMSGAPIEELAANPLPDDAITKIYGGEIPKWHMGNFLECVKTRALPISDVYSHHRVLTTCHLANIAIRLGRRINWDAKEEQIVGDPDAQKWQAREQRKGYEIEAQDHIRKEINRMEHLSESSRRDFLKGSVTTAGGALVSSLGLTTSVYAAGTERFNIALIGTGNRGTGAAADCLNVAKHVRLVAVADLYEERAKNSLRLLKENLGEQVNVPQEQIFLGLDAYKKVLACDVDLVILTTPPGFRPMHYKAAVEAGKHVFMEKPCCVDAGGYRSLVETNRKADKKGLKVGVGFFRRHFPQYLQAVERIHNGQIGDISFMRCYANMSQMATRSKLPGMTEMQYQVCNWHVFDWIGGGRLVEMHSHGLDAMNWVKGGHPVEVNGMGGRQIYRERRFGHDYDHHFNEFTYADGAKMYSQCRQMNGCRTQVTEHVHGTRGHIDLSGFIGGINLLKGRERVSPYQKEHIDLLDAIWTGKSYNEGWAGATSSFTAVIARMASYSGKVIKWAEAVEKGPSLFPKDMTWDADPPVMPDKDGRYEHAVAVPGVYRPYS